MHSGEGKEAWHRSHQNGFYISNVIAPHEGKRLDLQGSRSATAEPKQQKSLFKTAPIKNDVNGLTIETRPRK